MCVQGFKVDSTKEFKMKGMKGLVKNWMENKRLVVRETRFIRGNSLF